MVTSLLRSGFTGFTKKTGKPQKTCATNDDNTRAIWHDNLMWNVVNSNNLVTYLISKNS